MLIINADDLGMNRQSTDRIIAACDRRLITSATAMVFMLDTARAAGLVSSTDIGVGLHLNFTMPFSGPCRNAKLHEHHGKLMRFFLSWRYCRYLYNPSIRKSVHYCFNVQLDEFLRVFDKQPTHIDGHHDIHLAANVVFGGVLPNGAKLRKFRDFDNKNGIFDAFCRSRMADYLNNRFVTTDLLYSIEPLNDTSPARKICKAKSKNVELMVHPGMKEQDAYMNTDNYLQCINGVPKGSYADLSGKHHALR
jgi:predicted glycoside hydrolase/deacetylase ChbG (UPF0249 family)